MYEVYYVPYVTDWTSPEYQYCFIGCRKKAFMYMAKVGLKKHDFEDVLEYSEELGAFHVTCKFCTGHHYMNLQKFDTAAELFSCVKTKQSLRLKQSSGSNVSLLPYFTGDGSSYLRKGRKQRKTVKKTTTNNKTGISLSCETIIEVVYIT